MDIIAVFATRIFNDITGKQACQIGIDYDIVDWSVMYSKLRLLPELAGITHISGCPNTVCTIVVGIICICPPEEFMTESNQHLVAEAIADIRLKLNQVRGHDIPRVAKIGCTENRIIKGVQFIVIGIAVTGKVASFNTGYRGAGLRIEGMLQLTKCSKGTNVAVSGLIVVVAELIGQVVIW